MITEPARVQTKRYASTFTLNAADLVDDRLRLTPAQLDRIRERVELKLRERFAGPYRPPLFASSLS